MAEEKKAPAAKAAATKKTESSAADAKAPAAKSAAKPAAKTAAAKPAAEKAAPAKKAPAAKKAAAPAEKSNIIKLHHLRPAPGSKKDRTRFGRGEGSKGKTAGRGTKGTKARYQVPERFEGGQMPLHMRSPKLKGFRNPFRVEYQVVNVATINALFPQGGDVTIADLVKAGAVRKGELVKVLGQGDISVKVNVTADKFSDSAKAKITAAGGSVNEAK